MHSVLHIFRIVHTTRTHTQANMEAKFMPIESMYALLAKFGVPVDEEGDLEVGDAQERRAGVTHGRTASALMGSGFQQAKLWPGSTEGCNSGRTR